MPPAPTNPNDPVKGKIVIIGEYSVGKTCLSHRFINRSYTGKMEPTIGAAFQVRTLPVNINVAMSNQPVTQAVINTLVTSTQGGSAGGPSSLGGGGLSGGGPCNGAPLLSHSPSSLNDAQNGGAGVVAAGGAISHVKLELWDTAGSERYRSLMPMYFRDASAAVICYDISNAASFERVGLWLNDFRKHNDGGGVAGGGDGLVECVLCGTKCDINPEKREVSVQEAEEFAAQHGMAFFETSAKRDINVQELFFSVAHSIFRSKQLAKQLAASNAAGNGNGGSGGNSVNAAGGRGAGGKVDLSNDREKKSKSSGCC